MTLAWYDDGSHYRVVRVVMDEFAAVAQLALLPHGKLRARPRWIADQAARPLQNPASLPMR